MNYHASSKEEDGVIKIYDEHDDSICQVAWSHSTAWVFASISHSSNLIINMVPIAEKYKILL
jgi:EARP and GARP complex-interacting protein 1